MAGRSRNPASSSSICTSEALRAADARKEEAMAEAGEALNTAYAWLEERLSGRAWAAGESFTMADCAAAPSRFYADWVHQIGPDFHDLRLRSTSEEAESIVRHARSKWSR
jgi:glutathione S-transferase